MWKDVETTEPAQRPWENHGKTIGKWWFLMGFCGIYSGLSPGNLI